MIQCLRRQGKTYNVPMVAVRDCNGAIEKKREAPSIRSPGIGIDRADADVNMFPHKEDENNEALEIILGRIEGGRIGHGSCKVGWDKEKMIFKDLEQKREEKSITCFTDGYCEPRNPGGTASYGVVVIRDSARHS